MDKLLRSMRKKIEESTESRNKAATVHALIIINADQMRGLDAYRICSELGLPPSYHTEVKKAINTASMLDKMGHRLVEKV